MNFQSHNQFFKKSFPVPLGVFRVPKSVSSTEFTPEVKFHSIKVILTENRDLSQIYPKVRVANLWSQNYWRDAFLKNFQICSKTVKYVISTFKLAEKSSFRPKKFLPHFLDFLGVQPHEKSKYQFLKMVDFSDFVMPRILLYKMFES